jgi:alpha-galactosidase
MKQRSTRDISPHWGTIKANFLQNQKQVHRSQPGAWADPDMMEVGNGNLTLDESKSHFALWCLAKAPLWLGMDLTTMSSEIRDVISNRNLIGVNQDPGAVPAACFVGCNDEASWSVYATQVAGGDSVAIVVNWNDAVLKRISFAGYEIGIVPTLNEQVKMVDLWTNAVIGTFDFESLKKLPVSTIPPHGSLVYRFSILKLNGQKNIAR